MWLVHGAKQPHDGSGGSLDEGLGPCCDLSPPPPLGNAVPSQGLTALYANRLSPQRSFPSQLSDLFSTLQPRSL